MRFIALILISVTGFCRQSYAGFVAETLSSDSMLGRESGTPSAKKTADWIRDQYIAMGAYPAFASGYTQEFSFKAGVEPEKSTLAIGTRTLDGIPLPLSAPGSAEGKFAFGGYCVESDEHNVHDLATLDLQNRIVLCLRWTSEGEKDRKLARAMSFQSKWHNLAKRKAAGVIFLYPEGSEPPAPGDFMAGHEAGPIAISLPTKALTELFPWLASAQDKAQKGDVCAAGNECKGTIQIAYTSKQKTGYNVGAFLLPYVKGQRYAILGAHFDHLGRGNFSSMGGRGLIHNGADDNASGTAAVLAAAKSWEEDVRKGTRKLPENTNVLFLNFDAEERGLFGSLAFVNHSPFPLSDAAVMVNLDMVGRYRPEKGMTVQGKDSADPRLLEIFQAGFKETFPGNAKLKQISGGGGPSDHASFYMKGVPVAFLFTGYHLQYHKPEDDFALLNIDGIDRSSRYAAFIANQVLKLEKPLQFKRASEEGQEGQMEFRLRLGIMPGSYEGGTEGLLVGGVHKGAPVEKTGIQEGDVIISLGGKTIHDVQDLMEFLNTASADQSYTIVFMRNKERITKQTRLMSE
ncbi:MAG TPA: M28 family peptidase [Leptospiraceae bacterium]|nr:M28 family peptidase [Leptospirales bacterium]HMU83154.1 M28 family peptidase [Leptospiraceae bacterium]HMX56319.1 M28 family peptidase [Leptospiraceae bacterium]HNJ35209.1 M28 family peptidase [Leptospiraceae bacterium]HNL01996.1 M28 family peptidase [Leptospiraceae bacterium]